MFVLVLVCGLAVSIFLHALSLGRKDSNRKFLIDDLTTKIVHQFRRWPINRNTLHWEEDTSQYQLWIRCIKYILPTMQCTRSRKIRILLSDHILWKYTLVAFCMKFLLWLYPWIVIYLIVYNISRKNAVWQQLFRGESQQEPRTKFRHFLRPTC